MRRLWVLVAALAFYLRLPRGSLKVPDHPRATRWSTERPMRRLWLAATGAAVLALTILTLPTPAGATVTTSTSSVTYSPSSPTTVFSVTYPFLAADDLRVTKTTIATSTSVTLTRGVDYNVTLPVGTTNGFVTTTASVTTTHRITIDRVVPLTQTISFKTQGTFSPANIEYATDKLTMAVQQIRAAAGIDGTTAVATHVAQADPHPQYALLAGRAGGQHLKGGTAASENLQLTSTAHATKGKLLLGALGTSAFDEANTRLGIGTGAPTATLHVVGNSLLNGDVDLNGSTLYGQGIDQLTGALHYYSATKTLMLGIRDNAAPRMLSIGVCELTTGCTSDYRSVSGFQILGFGDIGITGSSAHLANINTVDSADNDTTFMLGGGSTLKRGAAFQFYNNGKFAGDTFDMAASANEQSLAHFSTGVNQTGTASYDLILGEVHETTTGSGPRRLLNLGINSNGPNAMVGTALASGTDAAGRTPQFVVETGGNVLHLAAAHEKWSSTSSAAGTADVGLLRSSAGVLQVSNGSSGIGAVIASTHTGSTSASGTVTLQSTSNATKGKILFGASGAYDEAAGRLGVGTTSPAAALDVTGDGQFTTTLMSPTVKGATGAGGSLTLLSTSNGSKGKIFLGSGGAYNETTGSLGLGTTTPAQVLDVVGAGQFTSTITGMRKVINAGASYTVVSPTDCGALVISANSPFTVTLPLASSANGCEIIVMNYAIGHTAQANIAPNATDCITGSVVGTTGAGSATTALLACVVNKKKINTAATAEKGDFLRMISIGSLTTAWMIDGGVGIWADEP